ncbi:MAG TPA: CDP-glycerol glycerophosphotransferase family protein [Propionibacteriaceae bacterium]|nr:CDP-glycerol glycerophosphotransferase family protein [Propionibacteriaceae bacterium]
MTKPQLARSGLLTSGAPRALRMLVAQVPLAVAVAVTIVLVGGGRAPSASAAVWGVALLAGVLVLAAAVAERVAGQQKLTARNLPGHREPLGPPRPHWIRFGTGVVIFALVITAWFSVWWAAAVLLLAGLAVAAVLGVALLRIRGRSAERARISAGLRRHAPRFAIYTGRRNDATYQVRMWLPTLEKLDLPYIVVVRHPAAVPLVAGVTDAPVICCPSASDLDCVAVESLRAAFYVNMVAENANFVLYRSMTHIYLGHGDSDKELSTHPAHAMFDKIFVAGPAARSRYAASGVKIPEDKFVVVGRPQLVAAQRAHRAVREAAPARVLVAPTWRGYNTKTTLSSLPVAPRLARELIDRGAAVIFRPHPFSWLGAAERAVIEATDALLDADRSASGRPHVLAAEQRSRDLVDVFNDSDAMVTDVGSVLVDYFVTGKPYAVVLPAGEDDQTAAERFPTVASAYLIPIGDLRAGKAAVPALDQMLTEDPLAERRASTTRCYLGDRPRDDGPFLDAVRSVIVD